MKIIFFFALLAIAASSASAQFDALTQVYRQYQLQPHLMLQQQMLSPCGEFVRQQCSTVATPFFQSPVFQLRSCQVMQQQCCQQLRMIAQQSHCQAINTVQAIVQQLQLQQFAGVYFDQTQAQAQALLALNLPSICGIYQSYNSAPCSIPTVGGVCASAQFDALTQAISAVAASHAAATDAQPVWRVRKAAVQHSGNPLLPITRLRLIAQQSHCHAIKTVQAIVQQLQLQQFAGVYFDQTQAQAQALLALNLPSICGIYQSYNSAPCSIPTVGGVWQYHVQPHLMLQQQMFCPCGEFVRQQCSLVATPFFQSPVFQLRNCQVMQQQCCQQLRNVAQQSRC
uniref:Bifunctional inhibitor/plant lipid transfer protein/seed storage helical domain-containing protein n=1 Tax=Oryza punctata TaxID=4537 RepID=A0A0E0ML83_ORYPU